MTDPKTWLDTNYPEEQRKNLTDLYLFDKDLAGKLDLTANFDKLERVWFHHELKIISNYDLTIASILKQKEPEGIFLKVDGKVEVKKYVPAEVVMENLYPKTTRGAITELDLTQKGLRGNLDLSDFANLEKLTLNLDCPWGRKYANSNLLTGLILEKNTKLTELILTNLRIGLGLDELNHLTALKKLVLKGESDEYPAGWTGSLEDLETLAELTELDISYCSQIKTGLEKLPKLEKLTCRGTSYEKQLKSFGGDVLAWKIIVFPEEVSTDKGTLVKKINEYLNQTQQSLKILGKKQLTDLDLESKVEILATRNRKLLG